MKRNCNLLLAAFLFVLPACGNDDSVPQAGAPPLGNSSPLTSMKRKLQASDAKAGDTFGRAVAVSEGLVLVGAPGEDAGGNNSGAVYLFVQTGPQTWNGGIKLKAPDAQSDDLFGASVAIAGDYAIVGAQGDDSGGGNAGAAYVFHRTGPNTWDGGTKLVAPDAAPGDGFGTAVALSGDYALVGANLEDAGGNNAGAAYVYHRTGPNAWDGGTKLIAGDAQGGNQFGLSVSIAGDYALVGAFGDDGAGSNAGAAYVFRRTGLNTWDPGSKLTAPDAQADDQFGRSVSILADHLIVGASGEDERAQNAGAAYIFRRTGLNAWDAGTKITPQDAQANDQFGESVSISGEVAVVGSPLKDDGSLNNGAAYIFQ